MGTPLGWYIRAGERLALMLVPSARDVRVGNSQVLERIWIHLLENIARNGMAILVLKSME